MLTDSTLEVIFFTRKKRNNPDKLDIYIRITVNQQRAEISLKRDIPVCNWDVLRGRGKGNVPNIQRLNGYLEQVYGEIFNSYKQLHLERKLITANAIKLRYLGEDKQDKTLMELVAYHNTTTHITLKPGTVKNYATTEKYLKQFLKDKKKANDVWLIQLNYRFIVDFEQFIRTYRPKKARRTCSNNETSGMLDENDQSCSKTRMVGQRPI